MRLGGARLRFSLSFQSNVCTARRSVRSGWARGCRPGLGAEQPPVHPAAAGFLGGSASRRRPLAPSMLPLLSSGPRCGPAGSEVTGGAGPLPQEGPLLPRLAPGSRGPGGDRAAGEPVSGSRTGPGLVVNLATWVTCPPRPVLAGVNYVLVQPALLFRERGAPSSSPPEACCQLL